MIVGGCAQGWLCHSQPDSFHTAPALLLVVFQRVLFLHPLGGCSGVLWGL